MLVDFKTFLKDAVAFSLEINGKVYNGIYNEDHVDHKTLPNNVYAYDVRDADNGKKFATLEDKVLVNFGGSVIFLNKINFGKKDYLSLTSKNVNWEINKDYEVLKGTALEIARRF